MEKYFGQQCQDDILNQKFRELHYKLVNEIISFCIENNIYDITVVNDYLYTFGSAIIS